MTNQNENEKAEKYENEETIEFFKESPFMPPIMLERVDRFITIAKDKARQQEREKLINEIEKMKVKNDYYTSGISFNQTLNVVLNRLEHLRKEKGEGK